MKIQTWLHPIRKLLAQNYGFLDIQRNRQLTPGYLIPSRFSVPVKMHFFATEFKEFELIFYGPPHNFIDERNVCKIILIMGSTLKVSDFVIPF